MEFLKIVALSVVTAIAYGILHDQVTARVCLEYFTIAHPRIMESQSPTLLAFAWGVLATWWVGLGLGVPLAMCCRIGPPPRISARGVLRPLIGVLCVMGAMALVAGTTAYLFARPPGQWMWFPSQIPPERQQQFVAAAAAHLASYAFGFLGGIFLCAWAVIRRFHRG
jgi:hypothetical protein